MIRNLYIPLSCSSIHELRDKTIIGYYSIDGNSEYKSDMSELKYYKSPYSTNVRFDLNESFERTTHKVDFVRKLDDILMWILQNFDKVFSRNSNETRSGPDFISYRGMLTRFMSLIYNSENWVIYATKFQGTIYLCNYETEEKRMRNSKCTQGTVRGFKFEQYLVSDDPNEDPVPMKPLNTIREFYCMYESRLNNYRLLYAAEMDGVRSTKKIENLLEDNIEFVEIKTSKNVNSPKDKYIMCKEKFVNWWCQSYAVGINHIVCGFRDNEIVDQIKEFEIDEIEKLGQQYWNTDKCKKALEAILMVIKEIVVKDYDKSVYVFESNSKKNRNFIHMREVDPNTASKYKLLPNWYIQKFQSLYNQ